MKVAIRADSGLEIGTGHIMRCLTLARGLREDGHQVLFVSKLHEGNIVQKVEDDGFLVSLLTIRDGVSKDVRHSAWLGGCQIDDAEQTIQSLRNWSSDDVDLIIVDHYAIDHRWESRCRNFANKIMVIDDLADRKHDCDYLLDQTYLRQPRDYIGIVSSECELMLGSRFALLREEFRVPLEVIRDIRYKRALLENKRILIMMGGTDHLNISSKILDVLQTERSCPSVTVVVGPTAPHYAALKERCRENPKISILSDISNVSSLMLNHDICFGAAGTASWERCALGLPSLVVSFAENQESILSALSQQGAVLKFREDEDSKSIVSKLRKVETYETYINMAEQSIKVCDGLGVDRVLEKVFK